LDIGFPKAAGVHKGWLYDTRLLSGGFLGNRSQLKRQKKHLATGFEASAFPSCRFLMQLSDIRFSKHTRGSVLHCLFSDPLLVSKCVKKQLKVRSKSSKLAALDTLFFPCSF
jgi:hypothetical protein